MDLYSMQWFSILVSPWNHLESLIREHSHNTDVISLVCGLHESFVKTPRVIPVCHQGLDPQVWSNLSR